MVAAGIAIAAIIELIFIRRLFESPRLVLLIATIGISQLLTVFKINLPEVSASGSIPLPFDALYRPTDHLRIQDIHALVLVVVPVVILLVAGFLTLTPLGKAVRASASNPDSARTFGISVRRTSTIVWAISGGLAAITGLLYAVLSNINSARAGTESLSPQLLLRVLIVALIARMRSLPMTIVGGLAVGLFEKFVQGNTTDRAIVDMFLFVGVLVGVLFMSRRSLGQEKWSLSPRVKAIPSRLEHIWIIRRLPHIGFALMFAVLAIIPLFADSASATFLWTNVVIFAIAAMSLTVLIGWTGQLSLAQFAFVGLGGLVLVALINGHDIPVPFNWFDWSLELSWGWALLAGTAAGVLSALAIGIPALKVKGFFLAVATLAFAVAAANWLLPSTSFFTGGGTATESVNRPVLWFLDFQESRRSYYYFCLFCLVVCTLIVARLRRTGIGRSMIAVRENEDAAEAATVSGRRMKLTAFAVSGGIAAFAGCLYLTSLSAITPNTQFRPIESLNLIAIAIIGGLGSIAGPILGTFWVRGIPAFFGTNPSDQIRLLTSSIGLLVLLMYIPGGLVQIAYWIRDGLLGFIARHLDRRKPVEVTPAIAKTVPVARTRVPPDIAPGQAWLKTEGVSVRFGGNHAVREVDIAVYQGELVGLIGTNGGRQVNLDECH